MCSRQRSGSRSVEAIAANRKAPHKHVLWAKIILESSDQRPVQRALKKWRDEKKHRGDPVAGPIRGTVDWLIAEYQNTTLFTDPREKTRTDYRNKLKALANFRLQDGERFGDKLWSKIEARHADKLYQGLRIGPSGDRQAYARLMVQAKVVWNYARRYHRREFKENQFAAMKLKTLPARGVKWTPAQVWAFCDKAEEMGRLSVAVAAVICYELGQRPGDARTLCRTAFEGDRIRVVQGKTGTELLLPVSDLLTSCIEKLPPEQ